MTKTLTVLMLALVLTLTLVLTSCSTLIHEPIEEHTYILLFDIPKDQQSSRLLTGIKNYHNGSNQWNLPLSLRGDVSDIIKQYRLNVIDVWPLENIHELCVVVKLDTEQLANLRADRRIADIQAVNHFDVMAGVSYNDPQFSVQFGEQTRQVEKLHEWSTGQNIKIGIIDTAIDLDHEDLTGKVISQQYYIDDELDLTDHLHGTAVAGIIAANSDNGLGVVGLAPDVALRSYAACYYRDEWQRTVCDTFALAKALAAAHKDELDILNLSLSGPEDRLLSRLIKSLIQDGTIVVAADNAAAPAKRFPASMEIVIAVATRDEKKHYQPPSLKIADEHLSTKPGDGYQFFYGTSMAAARASALIALIISKQSQDYQQVRTILMTIHDSCKERHDTEKICALAFAVGQDSIEKLKAGRKSSL